MKQYLTALLIAIAGAMPAHAQSGMALKAQICNRTNESVTMIFVYNWQAIALQPGQCQIYLDTTSRSVRYDRDPATPGYQEGRSLIEVNENRSFVYADNGMIYIKDD